MDRPALHSSPRKQASDKLVVWSGLALLVLAAGALIAAAPPSADKGHESPDAVWELFRSASAADDWAAVYSCYEPAAGRRLLGGLALNADARVRSGLSHDGQKTDEWNAIVHRTGLVVRREELLAVLQQARGAGNARASSRDSVSVEPAEDAPDADELLAAVVAGVDEPAECFRAVMVFMARVTGRHNPPLAAGQLERLSVHDDVATASATEERAGQRVHHSLHFRRIGANWFLEFPAGDDASH